eukprot:comp19677_c0_seq1/m.37744 comp19677_c0_seq1/g.37744  ORF comp19677_c0_seq1/g.37744 comp19677_c0_seq1/m.37744 type:complete len:401 (+) comp19677_c0_seq1:56-1258(+)
MFTTQWVQSRIFFFCFLYKRVFSCLRWMKRKRGRVWEFLVVSLHQNTRTNARTRGWGCLVGLSGVDLLARRAVLGSRGFLGRAALLGVVGAESGGDGVVVLEVCEDREEDLCVELEEALALLGEDLCVVTGDACFDVELLEEGLSAETKDEHGDEHDDEGGGKEGVGVRGVHGERKSKGDSATETGEPDHDGVGGRDGCHELQLCAGAVGEGDEEGDVEGACDVDEDESEDDQADVVLVDEGEGGEAEVDEDEDLCHFGADAEHVSCCCDSLCGHVRESVVGDGDAVEQEGDDTAEMDTFADKVGDVALEDDEADLERRVGAEVGVFEEERGCEGDEDAEDDGASKDDDEHDDSHVDVGHLEVCLFEEGLDCAHKHDGDGVVEDTLTKDDCVEVSVDGEL